MDKRGLSPLIASILLIAFTVILAAAIINWGSAFFNRISSATEEKTSKYLACTNDLNFHIISIKCPNFVTAENNGEIDIKKFILRFFKEDEFLGTGDLDGLNKNELQKLTVQNIPKSTNKIEFLAVVNVNGREITCSEIPKEAFVSC